MFTCRHLQQKCPAKQITKAQVRMAWAGGSTAATQARPPLTPDHFVPAKHQSKTSIQHIHKAASASPLSHQLRNLLDITFEAAPGQSTNVRDFLQATDTDGFLVMHRGQIITEEYPRGMDPKNIHAIASITRNVVASVTAILLERKQLDTATAVEQYIPELADTGFAGANIQQLLDMRSGVTSSMFSTSKAMRFVDLDPSDKTPEGLYSLLLTLPKEAEHGGKFRYYSDFSL